MSDLKLALRNLLRNRRRTLMALATIGFGVIALLQAGGFIEWVFWAMRATAIESRLGHVQVVRPGYHELGAADPFAYLLPERPPELAALEQMPGVEFVTPRLYFTGLISHGDTTISFIGEGVDPGTEAVASRSLAFAKGQGLTPSDTHRIIMGQGLAQNLGVVPGDTVVLLASTAKGGLNAVEVEVSGLFHTSAKAFDDTVLRLPIAVARELLRVSGAHVWVMRLEDTAQTDALLQWLQSRFPQATTQLQFIPWYTLADFYNKTVALLSSQMAVVWAIVALIILLSISNMLIMSVLERTGEIGTLMAVGLKRHEILRLFMGEGLLLGLIGGGLGLILGLALAQAISAVGIPMPPPPGMEEGYTGAILITWPLALGALVLAVVATVLASLFPAYKASRLQIVDALRHNR